MKVNHEGHRVLLSLEPASVRSSQRSAIDNINPQPRRSYRTLRGYSIDQIND